MAKDIILLRKRSEQSFGETLLQQGNLLSLLYILKHKKRDSISISKQSICFKIKNKITLQRSFDNITSIEYKGINETLLVNTDNKSMKFSLKSFRISYEEAKMIREKLIAFNN